MSDLIRRQLEMENEERRGRHRTGSSEDWSSETRPRNVYLTATPNEEPQRGWSNNEALQWIPRFRERDHYVRREETFEERRFRDMARDFNQLWELVQKLEKRVTELEEEKENFYNEKREIELGFSA